MIETTEIVLLEKDFENETQLCALVLETLSSRGALPPSAVPVSTAPVSTTPTGAASASAASSNSASTSPANLGNLIGALAHLAQPVRIVLKHNALDPTREAEDLHAITDTAHDMPADAIWFDVLSAALLEAETHLKLLDVIVYYDDLDEDEIDTAPTNGPLSAKDALELLRQGNLEYR